MILTHTAAQDRITEVLQSSENVVVHIFTDDEWYRKYYKRQFQGEEVMGALRFGPCSDQDRNEGASVAHPKPTFRRETHTKVAVIDFLSAALCDDFYGTAGSDVSSYIRAMKKKLTPGITFGVDVTIGDYECKNIGANKKFHDDLVAFIKLSMIDFVEEVADTPQSDERRIVDFLTGKHLHEIYLCMKELLLSRRDHTTSVKIMTSYLILNCRVARLNQERFIKVGWRAGNAAWLEMLINEKLPTLFESMVLNEPIVQMNTSTQMVHLIPRSTLKRNSDGLPSNPETVSKKAREESSENESILLD